MRPELALILGPKELVQVLRNQWEARGYSVEALSGIDQIPATPDALRTVLFDFLKRGGKVVHPGLSFWADRPEFPQIAKEVGVIPVSPPASVMSLVLNKVNFLIAAESVGISNLAVNFDLLTSLREIQALITRTGARFPLALKAIKGNSGANNLHLRSAADLLKSVPLWFAQLTGQQGEASVFLLRTRPAARQIIVPFCAYNPDEFDLFPWIDSSLQSRGRRMIQFCPAEGLSPIATATVTEWTQKLIQVLGFTGVGSFEFLVDGDAVFLIDGLARMSAAFPLGERLLGAPILEFQLAALGLGPRPRKVDINPFAAGMGLRLFAEDPLRRLPTPGVIQEISPSKIWNVDECRAEFLTAFLPGSEMSFRHFGVLGELFVFGRDRATVLEAARRALASVWVAGSVQTNQRYLMEHLEHPFVQANMIHAHFTDEDFIPQSVPDEITLQRCVTLTARFFPLERSRWVAAHQWVNPLVDSAFEVEPKLIRFEHGGRAGVIGTVSRSAFFSRFCIFPIAENRWMVSLGLESVPVRRVPPVSAASALSSPPLEKMLIALASGRVHAVLYRTGVAIGAHETIVVIESLRSLVPHAAPVNVTVTEWKVKPGDTVVNGQVLAALKVLG